MSITNTRKEKPWRCTHCGYQMNATGQLPGVSPTTKPPKDGDMTVCINCSIPYVRRNKFWREMRPEDWVELTTSERADLIRIIASVTESRIKAIIV